MLVIYQAIVTKPDQSQWCCLIYVQDTFTFALYKLMVYLQALIHGLNRHYYSLAINYRKNELEQKVCYHCYVIDNNTMTHCGFKHVKKQKIN